MLWRPGAVVIAATCTAAIAFLLIGSIPITVLAFFAGGLSSWLLLHYPDTQRSVNLVSILDSDRAQTRANQSVVAQKLAQLLDRLARLQTDRDRMGNELREQAFRQSREFRLRSLLEQPWKALRSEPFEQFLEAVFRELGYSTELTKVTGDQGVDLIVSSRGKRIAIQVKGYLHSVSNGAVQEAHAGKAYYKCDACAVITNSRFTPSALELATAIGCVMVDDDSFPKLILGQIDLWALCFDRAAPALPMR